MLTSLRKTWTWQSIRPGIRTLPFRLITWAVDDDSGRSDTSRTWPSSTNTSIFSRSSPFRGSSTRAALNQTDIKKFSRSEEHTSELQSLMRISYAVFCLNTKKSISNTHTLITILSHTTIYSQSSTTYSHHLNL